MSAEPVFSAIDLVPLESSAQTLPIAISNGDLSSCICCEKGLDASSYLDASSWTHPLTEQDRSRLSHLERLNAGAGGGAGSHHGRGYNDERLKAEISQYLGRNL